MNIAYAEQENSFATYLRVTLYEHIEKIDPDGDGVFQFHMLFLLILQKYHNQYGVRCTYGRDTFLNSNQNIQHHSCGIKKTK